ncbi:MAG: MFS transporter [Caldilineaceae bacterium]|nr:MFS transporter [Caldilineaceae bacterium]
MRLLLRNVTLWSLTLGHFSVDMLSGAMPIAVGLYLKDALGLSLGQIGLLLGAYQMTSSLTQPLFGYFSDRYGGRWFAVGGVIWMSILQGLVGFMPTFESALVIATLAGLGSAAFHPQGASGANIAAGEQKSAGVAMFMLGGNGGFAVGPILAALVMGAMGVRGTAVLGLVGLFIAPFLYFLTGRAQKQGNQKKNAASWRIELNPAFTMTAVLALILVMSLRAMSQQSFSSFTPQFFVDIAGFTKAQASLLSSVMLFVLAFGTLTGGMLADRIGGVKVMAVSMLVSAPLMALMFLLGDWRAFWVAPFLGFASGAAWPPMLVLAQSLFPKNAGVGSGVALGFVFAMGGIGLQVTGWLAEPQRLGLTTAMLLLSIVPLITAVLVFLLPNQQAGRPLVGPAATVGVATVKG